MTASSSQSCAVYDAGLTSSKAPKSPSWCTLIMQTSDIIGTQGRLGPGWLATCRKGSNTTYYWNTNLAPLTVPTPYHDDPITKGQIQTMKMSWYGQTSTSAKNTPPSGCSTWTVFTTIWTVKPSKHNTKTKKPSNDGHQYTTSPYSTAPTGITGLPWLSWQTTHLGGE